jgi:hypothetical protein
MRVDIRVRRTHLVKLVIMRNDRQNVCPWFDVWSAEDVALERWQVGEQCGTH